MHFIHQAAGSCPSPCLFVLCLFFIGFETLHATGSNLGKEHIEQDEEDQHKKEEATLSCFTLHCCCIISELLVWESPASVLLQCCHSSRFGVVPLPGGF